MSMIPTRDQPPRLAGPGPRPSLPGPGGMSKGMSPKDLLRIVRRHKWLILLTFIVVVGITVAGTFLWQEWAPFYTAEALLRVSPPAETLMTAGRAPIPGKDIIERYKRSQAALAKNQAVLESAAKDARITGKTWYQKHKSKIEKELDDEITVSVVPDTEFIALRMTGTNRTELADIVNAVGYSFVKWAGKGTRREHQNKISRLQGEKTALRSQLTRVITKKATMVGASAAAALQHRMNLVGMKLQQLTTQMSVAEIEQSEAKAAREALTGTGRLEPSENFQVQQALDFDPSLRALTLRETELKTQLDNARRKYGDKHRQVQNIRGWIAGAQGQIAERREEIIVAQSQMIAQQREMMLAIANRKVADLVDRITGAKAEARDLEEQLGRIESLTQEARYLEDSLRAIDSRILDLKVLTRSADTSAPGQEDAELGPVSMAQLAILPAEIAWPKWKVMLPLGAAIGLFLGLGLAFLIEFADTSIKSPSDLATRVDLPLLGMVPFGDDMEEEVEDFRKVTLQAPQSPASEAFRQIRTNLLYSGPAERRRSLLVTSAAPEDGRTTVVMNLAISMAQAGRRVLVVDANFRQPTIAEMYPAAAPSGLSSALVGEGSWHEAVTPTEVPNLSVLTAGPLPPNPAELLGSDNMAQLISDMTGEFDQVIFDGAPTLLVADATVLATQVDGVILVVRAGVNSAGIVQRASAQLHRVGAHVLGAVLQGVRTTAGGYLRKNYETYYEYHQQALP